MYLFWHLLPHISIKYTSKLDFSLKTDESKSVTFILKTVYEAFTIEQKQVSYKTFWCCIFRRTVEIKFVSTGILVRKFRFQFETCLEKVIKAKDLNRNSSFTNLFLNQF